MDMDEARMKAIRTRVNLGELQTPHQVEAEIFSCYKVISKVSRRVNLIDAVKHSGHTLTQVGHRILIESICDEHLSSSGSIQDVRALRDAFRQIQVMAVLATFEQQRPWLCGSPPLASEEAFQDSLESDSTSVDARSLSSMSDATSEYSPLPSSQFTDENVTMELEEVPIKVRSDDLQPQTVVMLHSAQRPARNLPKTATQKDKFCDKCSKYVTRSNFRRHLRDKHGYRQSKMRCPVESCNQVMGRKDNMAKHWRRKHSKDSAGAVLNQGSVVYTGQDDGPSPSWVTETNMLW